MKLVVGLGNPGEEYENTRHNTGRLVGAIVEKNIGDSKIKFLYPDTFMNKSGAAVAKLVKSKKDLKDLVVIYDDLDLPLGRFKISFNRSAGGHRGVQSIIRALKSEEFLRIRVGISPKKKPHGEKDVVKFILGKFKPKELEVLKKLSKKISEAIEVIFSESKEKAMSIYNS